MGAVTYTYEEGCIERFSAGDSQKAQCIEKIATILLNEHFRSSKNPFINQTALNLDRYERIKSGATTQSTVDFVVGLKGNWLLPVEAKLDVKNVDNITKDIVQKRNHSLGLLRSSDNYVHNTPFIVILLDGSNFQQKANRLKRLLNNSPTYRIDCVNSFYNTYFLKV